MRGEGIFRLVLASVPFRDEYQGREILDRTRHDLGRTVREWEERPDGTVIAFRLLSTAEEQATGFGWPFDRLLWTLVELDDLWRRWHTVPSLYRSGIRYRRDAIHGERWLTTPALREEHGDCKSLATDRCSELRSLGIDARPLVTWRWVLVQRECVLMYHVRVRLPDGSDEDPSRRVGMNSQDGA